VDLLKVAIIGIAFFVMKKSCVFFLDLFFLHTTPHSSLAQSPKL
jgi:hypothetical protein